jgi:hypothetical protein
MAAFEKVEQRNIQNKQQWYITKRISDRNMIYLLTMALKKSSPLLYIINGYRKLRETGYNDLIWL